MAAVLLLLTLAGCNTNDPTGSSYLNVDGKPG